MEWKYYNPVFECDMYNRDMLKYSPWSGHRNFVYDLIVNLEPEIVVELGSFYGCSSFAIGQAIKDYTLKTILSGIDIWETLDDFTKEDYHEDVYSAFVNVRDKCYSSDYIQMLKMSFEEARKKFGKKTIDILHIDGSHYYEDVKNDFESWKSALKDDAIVLFHDIGEDIINGDLMGSHIYWKELKKQYDTTFEFEFSCGLGVLCMSKQTFKRLDGMDVNIYQKKCNLNDTILKDNLRKFSFQLHDAKYNIDDLKRQLEIKDEHMVRYQEQIARVQRDYEKTITEKDAYIKELEEKINT
ncbi:class I SAM-dependent methyltransferase [Lacrimispora brassicae]